MTNEIIINLTAKDTATGEVISLAKALDALKISGKSGASGAKDAKKSTDELKKSAENATSAIKKLTGSIGRIAFYRAIRSAIKAVTQGIREGTNNLVEYSAAMNSLDASRASATMSELATNSLYLKNSVAAALMPVLQSLIPVIEEVANVIVFLANAFNQLIKALQGSGVFTAAKKYAVDYAESLKKVGKAAKEATKQVFGFDELNIFRDNSTTGSGASDALDFSQMFEEQQVGDGFKTLADKIKANLIDIEKMAGLFALGIGLILVASGHIAAGIGALAIGAALRFHAAGVNWDSLGNTIQGKLNNLIAFTAPVVMAIGFILALTGHIPLGMGMIVSGALMYSFASATGFTNELSKDLQDMLAEIGLVASLLPLALGILLVFTGDPKAVAIGLGMVAAGATGLATSLALDAGLLKGTLEQNLAIIGDLIGKAYLVLGAILLFVPGKQAWGIGALLMGGIISTISMSNLDVTGLSEDIKNKLLIIEGVVLGAIAVIGMFLALFGTPAMKAKGIMMVVSAASVAYSQYSSASDSLKEWMIEKLTDIGDIIKEKFVNLGKSIPESVKQGASSVWESVRSFFLGKRITVPVTASVEYSGNIGSGSIGRASGGFVDSGQMFIARENGLPEMVGTFGNQTAVANNSQIVEGIASGVESAMDNTNSVILQMANAIVNAIAEKEINTQVISDRDVARSAERGRTLTGATVYA